MRITESPRDGLLPELAPEGDLADALHWAVAHGCLAPSELNSQPWRFEAVVDEHGVVGTLDLLLDERRLLDAVDPTRREAVLACGAALLNVRLALQGAALGTHVDLCPDPARPDLLATLTVKGSAEEPLQDKLLRIAIPDRSTHRGPFDHGDIPGDLVERLIAEAAYEGAFVGIVDESGRRALAQLNREAEERLWLDTAFRHEVATWTRPRATSNGDGVPGVSRGLKDWQAWLEPARIRAGHPSVDELGQEREEREGAPLTVVLGSASDARDSLMRAGAGLERLLLAARGNGLSAGYLNAALHLQPLRALVGRALGMDHPQVVLRIGYAAVAPSTPRLWQEEVLHLRVRERGPM